MNLSSISPGSLSEALAWTIFHSIWQAALIAGLLALVFRLINKNNARLRYTMASLSMLLIFISAIFTFLLSLPTETLPLDLNISGLDSIIIADTSKLVFSWGSLKSLLPTHILFPILLRTWIVGICLLSFRMVINYTTALRLKKYKAFPLNEKHITLAYNVLERFKISKKVLFRESLSVDSPSLIGYFKPVILLPISLISGIPDNQLEIIIAHELAHISRHDYLIQFIQGIIEILFFYHPMVWWLSSVVNTEREHICDDLAVKVCGESLTLIKALNNMESIRRKKPELVLSFSGKKANLLHRVRRILNPVTVKHPKLERGLLSALFVFALSGMILFSNLANSKNQVQLESKNSKDLSIDDFERVEIPTALPIIQAPQKKEKQSKKKNIDVSVKPAVAIVPAELHVVTEARELNENVPVITDTVIRKDVEDDIKAHKEALEKYLDKVVKDDSLSKKEKDEARTRVRNSLKWVQSKKNKGNTKMTVKLDSSAPIHISAPKISFNSDKADAPLYILDGVEISKQAINKLDTGAFESVTILKDATSISTYGAKGKNGVILITSKNKVDKKKKSKKNCTIKIKGKTKKSPLYIVDGVEISKQAIDKLDTSAFESITILKDATSISTYGAKGKNGVILITSKNKVDKKKKSKKNCTIKIKGKTKNPPLYIVDGSKMDQNMNLKDINPDDIKSMTVLKDETAIEKYGKEGKNGVIEITTKRKKEMPSFNEYMKKQ
jgi:TonB-dependent SusC/RagA subfamily outer membrane receptor